jgi:hypothetical protein
MFWLTCCFHLQGRNQFLPEFLYLPIYTMSCPRILQSWCSLLWGPQILHTHKKSMFVHCLILLLRYCIEFRQLIHRLHHALCYCNSFHSEQFPVFDISETPQRVDMNSDWCKLFLYGRWYQIISSIEVSVVHHCLSYFILKKHEECRVIWNTFPLCDCTLFHIWNMWHSATLLPVRRAKELYIYF